MELCSVVDRPRWLLCLVYLVMLGSTRFPPARGSNGDSVQKNKFILNVSSSSPAVIGSNITFHALLFHANGSKIINKGKYRFAWKASACHIFFKENCYATSFGDESSDIWKVFTKPVVSAGTFNMSVTVYKNMNASKPLKVIGGSTRFNLTETLNGQLHIWQNSSIRRLRDAYATHQNISFIANVTDRFNRVEFNYTWTITDIRNKSFHFVTTRPHISLMLNNTGPYVIKTNVTALANVSDVIGFYHNITRHGFFRRKILLQDGVKKLKLQGRSHYTQGESIVMNATCSGSPPFNMSWSLTDPDRVTTLRAASPSYHCGGHFNYSSVNASSGSYVVTLIVVNAVSGMQQSREISLEYKASPVFAIVVTASVIIALTSLVALAVSAYLDRRRPSVETADFTFRSTSLEDLRSHGSVLDHIKEIFIGVLRLDSTKYDRNPASRGRSARYGALDEFAPSGPL